MYRPTEKGQPVSVSRKDFRLIPEGELIQELMTYEMQDDADDDARQDINDGDAAQTKDDDAWIQTNVESDMIEDAAGVGAEEQTVLMSTNMSPSLRNMETRIGWYRWT